jgi:uncharacterized membrane protein
MTLLVAGLIVFFAVHSVSIVADPWRNEMAERLGENAWKGIFAVISLVGLVLIVWGYGDARGEPVLLYTLPTWTRHLALLLLIPVFPLFVSTYFPGRIKDAVKHPTLVATKLWALAHLLANGMLADVLLFGAFLAWAVLDRISLKRRVPRAVPSTPPSLKNDVISVVLGLTLYVTFAMWIHEWLVGVPPVYVG